jgi:hypothetical protein
LSLALFHRRQNTLTHYRSSLKNTKTLFLLGLEDLSIIVVGQMPLAND